MSTSIPGSQNNISKSNEIPEGYKKCKKCGTVKPINDFCINKRNKDGRHIYCRECMSEIRKSTEYKLKDAAYHKKSYISKKYNNNANIPIHIDANGKIIIEYFDETTIPNIPENEKSCDTDILCVCEKCGVLFYATREEIELYCSVPPTNPLHHLLCGTHQAEYIECVKRLRNQKS